MQQGREDHLSHRLELARRRKGLAAGELGCEGGERTRVSLSSETNQGVVGGEPKALGGPSHRDSERRERAVGTLDAQIVSRQLP